MVKDFLTGPLTMAFPGAGGMSTRPSPQHMIVPPGPESAGALYAVSADGDEGGDVCATDGNRHMLLGTRPGLALRLGRWLMCRNQCD